MYGQATGRRAHGWHESSVATSGRRYARRRHVGAAAIAFGRGATRLEQLRALPRVPGEATFFYTDRLLHRDAVKVLPGERFVSRLDLVITTVLGSCIAACIWDGKARVGGMNHFMLPDGDRSDGAGRYGSYAMELLISELLRAGAQREDMRAKVFGGAQVMAGLATLNVGARNTRFVLDYLGAERIPVVAQDVLGIYPRKVCFLPVSGKAMVKCVAHARPERLVAQERSGHAVAVARWVSDGLLT